MLKECGSEKERGGGRERKREEEGERERERERVRQRSVKWCILLVKNARKGGVNCQLRFNNELTRLELLCQLIKA